LVWQCKLQYVKRMVPGFKWARQQYDWAKIVRISAVDRDLREPIVANSSFS
jgi:hypothetical protein